MKKMSNKQTLYNGIPLEIRRSDRKSISIEVTRECTLLVRAPQRMSERDIRYFLDKKQKWITDTMVKVKNHREEAAQRPAVKQLSEEEIRVLTKLAKRDLPARCADWAARLGVSYGRITIRHQKTRWGSCSAAGNLNFNCLLMEMPEEIRDYVVVHELCHRKEMNHSTAFWRQVERVMPEYRSRRKWLRENGSVYIAQILE